jgi:hypothetical protein
MFALSGLAIMSLRQDILAVRSAWLIGAILIGSLALILWVAPALFNRHDSLADLAALIVAAVALSCAYLAARELWRRLSVKGDTE